MKYVLYERMIIIKNKYLNLYQPSYKIMYCGLFVIATSKTK